MDPQQELISYLLVALKEKYPDIGIYDSFLPPEGTPYPFIYLADSHQTADRNKTVAFGNVFRHSMAGTIVQDSEEQYRAFC